MVDIYSNAKKKEWIRNIVISNYVSLHLQTQFNNNVLCLYVQCTFLFFSLFFCSSVRVSLMSYNVSLLWCGKYYLISVKSSSALEKTPLPFQIICCRLYLCMLYGISCWCALPGKIEFRTSFDLIQFNTWTTFSKYNRNNYSITLCSKYDAMKMIAFDLERKIGHFCQYFIVCLAFSFQTLHFDISK